MNRAPTQKALYEAFWQGSDIAAMPDWHILGGASRTGLQILSLGCGMGRDLWHLVPDHHVCGVELSASGAEIARRHGIDARVASVADTLPFADGTFDIVVAKDIVEHVDDPLFVLKEAARVMKPQGDLVLLIPNQFYWWARLRIMIGHNLIWKTFMHDQTRTFEEWNYIHIRFFTWKGVQRMLNAAGFRITKRYFDFGCLEQYFQPEVYAHWYRQLWQAGEPKSRRGLLVCYVLYPLWRCLNVVFPKAWRRRAVALAPGLLTASFYLRCQRDGDQATKRCEKTQ